MDFEIPEEYRALRRSLRSFIEREWLPFVERNGLDEDGRVPLARESKLALRRLSRQAGFYGIHLPEEAGGGGLGHLGTCMLLEEITSHNVPFGSHIIGGPGGPTPILLACTPEQRVRYLDPVMRAEKTTCFALTEPGAGSDASAIETRAVRDGDHWVVTGRKHFITNASYADFAMVFAVTDPERRARGGITCFLVDADTPGYQRGRVHETMYGSGSAGELMFDGCRVPGSQVLGEVGQGFALAMRWLGAGRLAIGAQSVGYAEFLLRKSVEYARQRVQFGRPIGHFQAIQFMLADMATERRAARVMVYEAAWRADRGQLRREDVAMVKLFASEMVGRCADRAVQIHGGMGYMRECPVERVYRRVRLSRIGEGTSEIQRLVIGRALVTEGGSDG